MEVLPLRKDVPLEETWNLQDLLENDADFEPILAQLVEEAVNFERTYQGTITDASKVIDVLTAFEALQVQFVPIGTYASLNLQADRTDDVAQMRAAKFGTAVGKISSALSFVRSELLALDEKVLEEAATLSPLYEHYLQELLKQKPHQLQPEVEKALAALSSTFEAPYEIYNTTKLVDMNFGEFEANGKKNTRSALYYSKMTGNLK